MRLSTIYHICKSNFDALEEVEAIKTSGKDEFKIDNWGLVKSAIDNLYAINSLRDRLDELYEVVPTVYKYASYIYFDSSNLTIFQKRFWILNNSVKTIIELYESMGFDRTEFDLEIKIPDNLELKKLKEMISDLDFVLNHCPIIEKGSNTSNIIKTDVGSIWLVLAGSATFLTSVGYLINVAIKAKADLVSIRQMDEMTREMEIKTSIAQELNDILDKKRKLVTAKYVDELKLMTNKELDNDEEGRVAKALEKLEGLISDGLKIYAAIDTPREIQVLFPQQPELKSINVRKPELIMQKEEE